MARAHTSPTVMGGLLALALTPAFWPTGAAAGALCPDTEDVQLTVGRSNDAGDVKVCNGVDSEGEFLRVTYEATYPFCLLDTQLHVATIPEAPAEPDDNIPQNQQGRPTPGQFSDFGLPDEGCQGTATYTIPLAEIGEDEDEVVPGDTVAIAARADLEDEDGKAEEAWGEGTRFVERGPWATYFTYEVQETFLCGDAAGSKCVFVTSSVLITGGDFGGLADGDAICNRRADEAKLPGDYKAWLSDDNESPFTRFVQSEVPYARVDGTAIADDWDDLVSCDPDCLDAPISLTEGGDGTGGAAPLVWTGSGPDGHGTAVNCGGWVDDDGNGTVGTVLRAADRDWTDAAIADCGGSTNARLYCFARSEPVRRGLKRSG